jgi:D-alanine-D-alanine ligase
MKAVVLHNEVSKEAPKDEQDVLVQVDTVAQTLSELGYETFVVPFSLNLEILRIALKDIKPFFVFNLVESFAGHDALIYMAPSVMDAWGIPYTGSKTESIFLTTNKPLAKKCLNTAGIPTPSWLSLDDNDLLSPLEGAFIIKSVWEHASAGLEEDSVLVPKNTDHLRQEIKSRQIKLGKKCFAEHFIEGREFNLSLLDNGGKPHVLSPTEIRFDNYPAGKIKIVGYRAKWENDSFECLHTPRSFDFPKEDEQLIQQMIILAKKCWYLFDLRGYARVDFRVDQRGKPWVLEVNANPCLSPDAGFFAAARRDGLTFHQVIQKIIENLNNAQIL